MAERRECYCVTCHVCRASACKHRELTYRYERMGSISVRRWLECECGWTHELSNDLDEVLNAELTPAGLGAPKDGE